MKFFLKTLPHLNFVTKGILVSIILLMTIIGGFSIRMSQGPMDLNFIKPRIEEALSDIEKGYTVSIGNLALSWDALNEPILLDLNNVKIDQEEVSGASVEKISIGLSAEHLLIGKILPSVVIIEDSKFQLARQDGEVRFFWQESKPSIAQEEIKQTAEIIKEERIVRRSAREFIQQVFASNKSDLNILSALKRVELRRAVITSANQQGETQSYMALIDLSLQKTPLGLRGDLNVSLPGQVGQNATLKSDVVYRRAEQDITFTASIKDINPVSFIDFFPKAVFLKDQNILLNGQIQAAFDEVFKLQLATLDLNIPEGKVQIPEVYDDGLELKDILLKANFNRGEKTLDVSTFQASVGGIPLEGNTVFAFDRGNITAPITLKISEAKTSDISAVFPKSHLESPAGEWLTKKLSEGRLYDLVLNTDFQVMRDPQAGSQDAKMVNTKASFKADGLTVKYSDTLMPVTNVRAEGRYEDDTLFIEGESGTIKDVTGSDINLKMTNLSVAGGGMAYLTLDADGPFKTVLEYVSDEPIAVGDTLGFDPDMVQGNVNFNLNLEFPTIKDLPKEQVIVKIKGRLNDVMIPNIVRGLPLTGGPYDLSFADGAIELKGSGELAKRPITLTWKEYLDSTGQDFESRITAQIMADEGLRDVFGIGLKDYISGTFPVDVTYTDYGVKADIDIKGDLTPATLHIQPFKFKKAAGVASSLALKAYMNGDTLEEVDQLSLSTNGFSLSEGRLIFRKLSDGSTDVARGSIAQAKLGKTNLKVDFEITPQDVLKIVTAGPVFDLAPFISSDKKEGEWNNPKTEEKRAMKLSIQAQTILAEKEEVLKSSKIYLEADKQGDINRIEMDAKVGQGDMYLRFKPDQATGKRTFRLESTDAGRTLKAFGLYDKIRGGKLIIYGEPRQGDHKGDLFGKAKIEDFSVRKAPALAKLLGAMSQNGVEDVLQNNGLAFAKLETGFEWQFRPAGNLLIMKDGRTSGSSLGLTFEGVYNQGTNMTDISGTVIPLSGVNKAIGDIPVIGSLLTGGKALLAATYTVSGASADPKVVINPLSVLAPGFLRKILFEESVESKVEKQ